MIIDVFIQIILLDVKRSRVDPRCNYVIHMPIKSENIDMAPVLSEPCIKSDTQLQVGNLMSTVSSNVTPPQVFLSALFSWLLFFFPGMQYVQLCVNYVIYNL